MTQHARVVSGTVVEILTALDGHALADCFPEAIVVECVDAPDTVQPGWTYDGKAFAAPAAVVTMPTVRSASGYALLMALTDDQRALYGSLKAWDQRRLSSRTTPWPENNDLVARAAPLLKTTPKAWFDAALGAS